MKDIALQLPSPSLLNQHWKKITFINALCQRHQANFDLFCESIDDFESPKVYNKALNKSWEYLAGQLKSMKNLDKTLQEFESILPNTDSYDGYGVYPALDACTLLVSSLEMILDESVDDSDIAGSMSLATVRQFVALILDQDSDDETLEHDLIRREIEFQNRIYSLLEGNQLPQQQLIKDLRKELSLISESNLGIEVN